MKSNKVVSDKDIKSVICAFAKVEKELQPDIIKMADIINDAKATDDEKREALVTIRFILYPDSEFDGLD